MKKRYFIIAQITALAVEAVLLLCFALWDADSAQDAVAVNEVLQSVESGWGRLESHERRTGLNYVVLDGTGEVLFRTDTDLSESVNRAVAHRDTILDIENAGLVVGKLIVFNDSAEILESGKRAMFLAVLAVMLAQWGVCIAYGMYLDRAVVRPFRQLKDFARRVAGGNLDIPLEMDRGNLFGAFTESFDIMREELKKARLAEAKANAEKKELVAKLSHDIRTPVASIKAASEVGAALAQSGRIRENYGQIIRKADQIDALVNNLFTAALEELERLAVNPVDMESGELAAMLKSADYFGWAQIPPIPECLLHGDRLRLQQVFDNIFANAYKYGRNACQGEGGFQGQSAQGSPILLPVATQFCELDPIQFGIMVVLNCGIGLLTPPVGAVLFIGSAVAKRPMEKVVKATLPFYVCMIITLLLVSYWQDVSLIIPKIFDDYKPVVAGLSNILLR